MKPWILPSILVVLSLFSLVILRSVAPSLVLYQAVFFVVGAGIFWLMSKVPFAYLQQVAGPLYVVLVIGLIVSFSYGLVTGRTGRWIPIAGLFNVQPSQLAIPIVALCVVTLIKTYASWSKLFQAGLIVGIPAILILIEPDLGTTIVYLASLGVLFFVSDLPWSKVIQLGSIGIIAVVLSWFLVLRDYQKARITSFINPTTDTQDSSYNARQALIAVGSGQLTGRGLGQGVQSHLRFLPERQTDFIFASLAEEMGFIGAGTIIALYAALLWSMARTLVTCQDRDQQLFIIAILTMTSLQTFVNIGMNMRLLPITGVTLPFLSYGGSSILSLSMMYGIIHGISLQPRLKSSLHLE